MHIDITSLLSNSSYVGENFSFSHDFDFNGCFLQIGLEDTIKDIVGQTSGFMPRDLHALIADAGASLISKGNVQVDEFEPNDLDRSLKAVQNNESRNGLPHVMGKEYLAKALDGSKKRNASALGTPKVD